MDDETYYEPLVKIASFQRPADTTAYASGDLVANSTTVGSVVPLSFECHNVRNGVVALDRCRIKKTGTSLTNAIFALHLFRANSSGTYPPAATNGDNGAFTISGTDYLGAFDVTLDKAFSDGCVGAGIPRIGARIQASLIYNGFVYGYMEARSAYTPANAETFTVTLEGWKL